MPPLIVGSVVNKLWKRVPLPSDIVTPVFNVYVVPVLILEEEKIATEPVPAGSV